MARCCLLSGLMLVGVLSAVVYAQPVVYAPGGATRALDMDPWQIDCIIDPDVRYVRAQAASQETQGIDFLILGINIEDSVCTELPYDLIVTGYPGAPPPGITAYSPGACWWQGAPVYACDEAMSAAVEASPANPIPGKGEWRVFLVPLYPSSLPQSSYPNIDLYYIFRSEATVRKILDSVNGLMSGTISAGPVLLPDTLFYFDVPWEAWPLEPYKMHFPQYPDSAGIDVNFTYPLLLGDDWTCTASGPVDHVRFWFSARGDWFDPYMPVIDQIANIHLAVYGNIPDFDYNGPLYSMPDMPLWEADFPPDAPGVTFDLYAIGSQAWYDPLTLEYIPDDHEMIYECVIGNIEEPFLQEEGEVYWLAISMQSAYPEDPYFAFGWKTSDLVPYPADYRGRRYMDDAVWADGMIEDWVNLTYPAGPDSGESLDLAFILSIEPQVCGDGRWGPVEWCGQDCYAAVTSADMTHDCVTDLMDYYLFAADYMKVGPGLSGDYNGSGQVDLYDYAILVTYFNTWASPCNPADQVIIGDPAGKLHLSFTPTPEHPQTYIIGPSPGMVRVYLVARDLPSPLGATELGIVCLHPDQCGDFVPEPPFLLDLGTSLQDIVVAVPSEITGPAVVGYFDFIYLGEERVSFDIEPNSVYGGLKWISPSSNIYHDWAMASSAFIYSGTNAGVTPPDAPARSRLYASSPNPFESTTSIRYDLAREDRVRLAVYDVRGKTVRTLIDVGAQPAGWHAVEWDGRDDKGNAVAPGVYFYRLETARYSATQRMTLLR
jgi:hypothetical protein